MRDPSASCTLPTLLCSHLPVASTKLRHPPTALHCKCSHLPTPADRGRVGHAVQPAAGACGTCKKTFLFSGKISQTFGSDKNYSVSPIWRAEQMAASRFGLPDQLELSLRLANCTAPEWGQVPSRRQDCLQFQLLKSSSASDNRISRSSYHTMQCSTGEFK